jgi:hypothetical protein
MKAFYSNIKKIESFLNTHLAFFFANGNKQNRVENYYTEN